MALNTNDVDFGEQNIIYITEQTASEWTIDATRELIRLYDEKTDLFEKGIIKTKKILFETVASEMVKKSLFYNPQQCENKWKSLKRSYITRLEKNPIMLKTKPKPFESEIAEIVKRERTTSRKSHKYSDSVIYGKLTKREVLSEDSDNEEIRKVLSNDNSSNTVAIDPAMILGNASFAETEHDLERGVKRQATRDLVNEVRELKKVMRDIQQNVSRHVSQTQQAKEEELQLKKAENEKQNEIVQQMKIQNSLLAKLVQKLGS